MEGLIALLVLGALAASVYFIAESRNGTEPVSVNRPPAEIIALAVAQVPGGTARRKGQRFLKQLQAQTLTAGPVAAALPGGAE